MVSGVVQCPAAGQWPGGKYHTDGSGGDEMPHDASWVGSLLALFSCMMSAFGGIYSEVLLKKDGSKHSIHLQNAMLYACGALFNSMGVAANKRGPLLQGYSPAVVVLIFSNALGGLAISAVLKFADNMARVFAHAAATLASMAIETALLAQAAPLSLVLSAVVVLASTYIYAATGSPPRPAHQAAVSVELEEHQSVLKQSA